MTEKTRKNRVIRRHSVDRNAEHSIQRRLLKYNRFRQRCVRWENVACDFITMIYHRKFVSDHWIARKRNYAGNVS